MIILHDESRWSKKAYYCLQHGQKPVFLRTMEISNNKRFGSILNHRVFQHSLYWLVLILIFALFNGFRHGNFTMAFVREISITPARMLGVYFILYVLLPTQLFQKKYGSFFFSLIGVFIVTGLLQRMSFHAIYYPLFVPHEIASKLFDFYRIMDEVFSINTALIVPLTVKIMRNLYQNQQVAMAISQEKLEAELKALKNQVNPHFLFNTLNNLYGLALKKAENLPEMLLKLSDMLSYMLYECNGKLVPLRGEIRLLENYLALEKLRYKKELKVDLNIQGDMSGTQIPPLLLLPLVENSFKHGVSQQYRDPWVIIDLRLEKQKMSFYIQNSVQQNQGKESAKYQGIGIENVQKRLDLLYPDHHSIKFERDENSFTVRLTLDLNE